MSHIVKGKVLVRYTDRDILIKSLSPHGKLFENAPLYQVGNGYTSTKYQIVLVSNANETFRIGFNLKEGVWEQFQEDYGSVGEWTKQVSQRVQDRYLAFGYEQKLKSEGYDVKVTEKADGTFEVLAEEETY